MPDDPHATGGPATHIQRGARTPTHAERVRTLVTAGRDGVLSTLAADPAGHPFGSLVTYALDDGGAPLLLLSTMAEHTRNLVGDPRASLLVSADAEGTGRLAAARSTLLGTVTEVPGPEQEAALRRYRDVHPDAFWADFPDFAVYRLAVTHLRYVRGFGEMSWVDAAAYAAAEADPLAGAEAGIVAHMNDDHADSLVLMVREFLDVAGEVRDVTMLGCDRYGFEVRMTTQAPGAGSPRTAYGRIGFVAPLTAPGQARGAMVELVRRARGG